MSKSLTNAVLDSRRAPVNQTAGRVLATGQHWSDGPCGATSSDSPNPIRTYPVQEWMRVSPKMVDLTGRKVGFLTVIGFAGNKRWVARCVCGIYTLRTAKAITKTTHGELACCDRCNKKNRMEWRQKHKATGA